MDDGHPQINTYHTKRNIFTLIVVSEFKFTVLHQVNLTHSPGESNCPNSIETLGVGFSAVNSKPFFCVWFQFPRLMISALSSLKR